MGQVCHGRATIEPCRATGSSTMARATPSEEQLSNRKLGLRSTTRTAAKWRTRATVEDMKTGPPEPLSTVLSETEGAMIVAFRRHAADRFPGVAASPMLDRRQAAFRQPRVGARARGVTAYPRELRIENCGRPPGKFAWRRSPINSCHGERPQKQRFAVFPLSLRQYRRSRCEERVHRADFPAKQSCRRDRYSW